MASEQLVSKTIARDEIESYIPHRYENVLIDYFKRYPENEDGIVGAIGLKISQDDPLGRTLFTKQKTAETRSIMVPVLMEIMALGAIVSVGPVPEGKLVFYVGISKFKKVSDFIVGEELFAELRQLPGRKDFIRFSGNMYGPENRLIASGNMMAFVADVGSDEEAIEKKQVELPEFDLDFPINKVGGLKQPEMMVVDKLVKVDLDEGLVISQYSYPVDHPLIKGHFPKKPVMMGIMQWMAMEDAAYALGLYLKSSGKSGRYTLRADAEISNQDRHIIATARGLVIEIFMDVAGVNDQAEIVETSKITFRDQVEPGDTLAIKLLNITLS